jgi:hypothetical protein
MRTEINAGDQVKKIYQVEAWLNARKLNHQNTRFFWAKKWLLEGIELGEIEEEKMVRFQWALQELDDYVQLHNHLGDESHERFISTLRRSFKGPAEIKDETGGASIAGRNYMFELVVAARLKQVGFDLYFDGDADATLNIDGTRVYVECKQALGENPRGLLVDAFKQIRRRCEERTDQQFGIGVLGLTRYVAQECERNGPLVADDVMLNEEIMNVVSKFSFSDFGEQFPEAIGVITHVALPYWRKEDMTLAVLRRFDFHELRPNHSVLEKLKQIWMTKAN